MDKGGSPEGLRAVVDASVVVKWGIPGEPWRARATLSYVWHRFNRCFM
jgi:hypothetical protein